MEKERPEPMERLEEFLFHPSDKTLNAFHSKGLQVKRELSEQREELTRLLTNRAGTESEIASIRKQIAQKHEELMEILKVEEKISRELEERDS